MTAKTAPSRARTTVHWQQFSVPYEFPVYFTANLFDPVNESLIEAMCRLEPDKRNRCLFFVDDGLIQARPELVEDIKAYAAHHVSELDLVTDPIAVPGGEKIKSNLHFVETIQQALFDHHIDRHSYVLAIGGGAVLDAVGLVAATAHRGIRHIRIPTTVLAQSDSGVGVKMVLICMASKTTSAPSRRRSRC